MRRALVLAVLLSLVPLQAQATTPDTCLSVPVNDGRASDGPDFLTGSDDADVIALGPGADQYFAAGGGDVVCGNLGDDLLVGEGGADSLDGGFGSDQLFGFSGDDLLRAGPGADSLDGGGGDDVLVAAAGDDQRDDLYDGPGQDVIIGQAEDVWHRCIDETSDEHSAFDGTIVPDETC